jgi:hypothetical protein
MFRTSKTRKPIAGFVKPYISRRPGNGGGPSRALGAASRRSYKILAILTEVQKKPPSEAVQDFVLQSYQNVSRETLWYD